MKISKTLFICLITLNVVLFTSCNNDDDNATTPTTTELTEQEAVELIESSLQKSTGGFNDNTEKFAEDLTTNITLNETCDVVYSDVFVINYNEAIAQASYTVDWSYEMTCNNLNIPQSVVFSFSTDGEYSTQRITSSDNSISSVEITGLQPSASTMTLNGDYSRVGMQQLTVINTRSVSSTININLTDIIIDKSSSMISSGTASVTLTGTSQNRTFSFEGTIIFNGNGTATLSINGTLHEINLG